MPVTPVFDLKKAERPMRVGAFMSGSGTNIMKLIEREKEIKAVKGVSPFEVVFIFSDRSDGNSAGEKIACENSLPYFSHDIRSFYWARSLKRSVTAPEGMAVREEYDSVAKRLVDAFEIDIIALGGYMSYITLKKCVNVHPADLSIRLPDGRRRYVGDNAVYDAIVSGENMLRASTLWTDEGVDTGPLLMVSEALPVELPQPLEILKKDKLRLLEVVDKHQERLKERGDWNIFPLTIEMIAMGRFGFDEDRRVYVDNIPALDGYRA